MNDVKKRVYKILVFSGWNQLSMSTKYILFSVVTFFYAWGISLVCTFMIFF